MRAGPERSSEVQKQRRFPELALSGSPDAGDADAGRRAEGRVGASLATGGKQSLSARGEGGCSPGAVWLWSFRSIGTARATDTDGSHECWRKRRRAGCHHALSVAHEGPGCCQRDIARSHQIGGESPHQGSGLLSRMERWQGEHTPRREERVHAAVGGQAQIPWSAPVQVPTGVLTPGAGSRSIEI